MQIAEALEVKTSKPSAFHIAIRQKVHYIHIRDSWQSFKESNLLGPSIVRFERMPPHHLIR